MTAAYRAPGCLAAPLSHASQRPAGRLRRARHLFLRGRSIPVVLISLVFAAISIATSLSSYQPPGLLLTCCIAQGVLLFVVPFPLGTWRLRRAQKRHLLGAARERARRALPAATRELLESDSLIDQEVGLGRLREAMTTLSELQRRVADLLAMNAAERPRTTPRFNLGVERRRRR